MAWRSMTAADLEGVKQVSDRVHTQFPEDRQVFEERLRLYPAGCLVCDDGTQLIGYAVTHPWIEDSVPALNSLLGAIPTPSNSYYFHDVALLDAARGRGLGAHVAGLLKRHAWESGYRSIGLVAVNRSSGFWEQQGFQTRMLPSLREKLLTYALDAAYMQGRIGPSHR